MLDLRIIKKPFFDDNLMRCLRINSNVGGGSRRTSSFQCSVHFVISWTDTGIVSPFRVSQLHSLDGNCQENGKLVSIYLYYNNSCIEFQQ